MVNRRRSGRCAGTPKKSFQLHDAHLVLQLRELYELLSVNYIEDDDASFRFQYSAEFLRWCVATAIMYSALITRL